VEYASLPPMFPRWLHILFFALCLTALHGADVTFKEIPEKPQAHVLDNAGLFRTNPKELKELQQKLIDLQTQRGFPLYLVIEGTLIGTAGTVEVDAYQKAWIGDGPGIVILMEADAGRFNVSQPQGLEVTTKPGQSPFLPGPQDLTPVEVNRIVGIATDRGWHARNANDMIRLAVDFCSTFADGIDYVLLKRAEPEKDQTTMRVVMMSTAAFAVTAILLMIAYAVMRRSEHRQHTRFVFPNLQVGQRLGAHYSGGKTISRRF
jgi:hypothetical protein